MFIYTRLPHLKLMHKVESTRLYIITFMKAGFVAGLLRQTALVLAIGAPNKLATVWFANYAYNLYNLPVMAAGAAGDKKQDLRLSLCLFAALVTSYTEPD